MEKLFYKSQKRKRLRVSSSSSREGEERVGKDLISLLPEPLLCHILSFLATEQAVWTSVLSSRWRHLWKWVPRLELDSFDFANDKACVDFIHKFLALQGKPYLREFKLTIDHDVFDSEAYLYEPCLGKVDMQKLETFEIKNKLGRGGFDDFRTRLTLSACEALVCLKLHFVSLNDEFESLSFPCLKTMFLDDVVMPSEAAAEALISSSPVLEVLKICLSKDDFVVALRVCSPSLKRLSLKRVEPVYPRGRSVVIDAPKLEYLSLVDYYHFRSFEIISKADESLKVDIDVEFELMTDYLSEKKIIYNLLNNFSGVKVMTMSWRTLQELLIHYPEVIVRLSTVLPPCLVSCLESVEMESPVTEVATELDLARYFMNNSTTLKNLVLRLNESSTGEKHKPGVLEQLIEYPRRPSLCQFEVIPVVPISESNTNIMHFHA